MIDFLKSLFCRHDWQFAGNLYGDQIAEWGWKRSVWTCSKCNKSTGRDHLYADDGLPLDGSNPNPPECDPRA